MSVVSAVTKAWACQKLYRYLSRDFKDLAIYKAGIIDATGKQIVKSKDMTPSQKRMFGAFEKLMIFIKRVLKKHGVTSLALAVTFLETKDHDSFFEYLDRLSEDDSVKKLLEELEDSEKIDEEGEPATTTGNMAQYVPPLGMTRRKKHD